MYLKPVAGRQVPDPDRGDFLPDSGRDVVDQQYWLRRLNDGDVEISSPPTDDKAKATTITAKE